MQKRILVPNGNYTDIPLIKAYKEMGLYVITSGNAPELEGHKYADEYIAHDYSDKEGMLELARGLNLDYVSSCANDFGVLTGAYIAEHLGLPGHDTFRNAQIIAEKDHFKKFGQENGLLVIPSAQFQDEAAACAYAETAEYPIIIKPTDLTGGKGVTRVDDPKDAPAAIAYAFGRSKAKHVVIEPFIEGTQHSFCAFLVKGKVVTYTSFNEFDSPYNPFLVGYTSTPAENMDRIAPILKEQTEKMAQLLNLVDGIFHIQYRVHNGKPMIMECMRRCLGNYALQCTKKALDIDYEKWIARAYCGMDCSEIPHASDEGKWIAHFYIQAPRDGRVKDVRIAPELEKYIYNRVMQWQPGLEIDNYQVEMLGFLFLEFETKEERDAITKRLFNDLVVVEMMDEN